ncbi:MAG: DUF1761 domain-containing protein [Pseudooceanicola sp.]
MSYTAVLVAAAAGFGAGAIWYLTFAGIWLRSTGLELNEHGKPVKDGSYWPFVVGIVCMILVAGMMRHIFSMAGIEGSGKSFLGGLGIGAFFITPWMAMNYAYAMRPARLSFIDGGYAIVGCGVIGLVLGMF